jgi:hypothetical protein
MTRVRELVGFRTGKRGVWMVLAALALGLAFAAPALGTFGSTPSKECSNSSWNGEYWKAEIDGRDYSVDHIETSANVAPSTISLSINKYKKATWSLHSDAEFGLFRIYEKGGHYSQTNSGFWLPGQGGTFYVEKSISHITFCFKDIPQPAISVEKKTNGADPTATNPNYIPVGAAVTWTYEVKNTGSVTLKDVVVTDSDLSLLVVRLTGDSYLDPGEKWTYKATGVATAGAYANTGTVTAESKVDSSPVTASNGSGYFGSNPSIHLEVFGPEDPVLIGSTFDWLFKVTNTGNVPLSAAVVTENGLPVGNCSWPTLAPGAVVECELTETATLAGQTSTFIASGVFDDGITQKVVSETVAGVEYEANHAPVAVDDAYSMDERDLDGPSTLIIPVGDGVIDGLGEDTDADGDPLSATLLSAPTNGGSVTLALDGSFEYTPSDTYEWGDEVSRIDTWTYTVSDGNGGSDVGSVAITVSRNLCEGETVSSPGDQNVTASFTLTSFTGCKDFPTLDVDTSEASVDGTVLFQPPAQTENGEYVGVLTVFDVDVELSDLDEVVLRFDPTGGETFQLVPACDGSAAEPMLPGAATTGWCFYDLDFDLDGGLWDITWFVYGIDDPKFVFK